MKKSIAIILTFLFLSVSVFAQSRLILVPCCSMLQTDQYPVVNDILEKQIDEIFAKWNNPESPGCAFAVVKDGEVIFKKGYGKASLEHDIPITTTTIFDAASVSKQFTAFAIILLEQDGKLSFDDDIRKYLLYVPDFGHKITIRHLIFHTSGLRDQWDLLEFAGVRMEDDIVTQEDILKLVKRQKELNFPPGESYKYCNTGYTLLAEIVAKVSNKSFQEFTEERIFRPLEMFDTHFHSENDEIIKNRAYPYEQSNDKFFNLRLGFLNFGPTGLYTTVEDVAKWIINFETHNVGGRAAFDQLLEHGTLKDGTILDYCFGIMESKYRGLRNIHHVGGAAGYESFVQYYPDHKIGFAILANHTKISSVPSTNKVAKIFLGDIFEKSESIPQQKEIQEIKIDSRILESFVGEYEYNFGENVKIEIRNNRLFEVITFRNSEHELFAESENLFFTKPLAFKISFQRNDKGRVSQLTWHYPDGRKRVAKRVNYQKLDSNQLAEFTGNYLSEELGTMYTFIVIDGKLVSTHLKNADSVMTQTNKDIFRGNRWPMRVVAFERNDENAIAGFRVSTSRVKNLLFKKID